MLNENLTALRKAKQMSQEELAIRLNVVRQTVSKWERGHSVPDADMLIKIAEVLEVSVSDLLGDTAAAPVSEPDSVAVQLSRINEQLAIKNRRARRIWKGILWVVIAVAVINILLAIAGTTLYAAQQQYDTVTEIESSVMDDRNKAE